MTDAYGASTHKGCHAAGSDMSDKSDKSDESDVSDVLPKLVALPGIPAFVRGGSADEGAILLETEHTERSQVGTDDPTCDLSIPYKGSPFYGEGYLTR